MARWFQLRPDCHEGPQFMFLDGSLTKNEIAEIMKQHENTGMGKKRNSRSSSLQPKKDSLFPADLSKIDENKEVTSEDLKLGLSIGASSKHRPSEVSIVSNFGETDYLQLHRCEKLSFGQITIFRASQT